MDDSIDQAIDSLRELRVEMNSRFDSLHRTLLVLSGGLLVSLFGFLATFVLTQG